MTDHQVSVSEQASSVLSYSLCSISMIILNKSFVRIFDSKLNFTILLIQNLFGLFIIVGLKKLKIIDYPNITVKLLYNWTTLAMFNVGMISTSLLT